jgi:hypothetical protein
MNTPQTTELTARVAVRVPRSDEGSLLEGAHRRLEHPAVVERVDVVELDSVEPALAATVVELDVRVTVTTPTDGTTALEAAPGTERVEATRS